MPRNTSGVYSLPPSNPVVPYTTIATSWANPTMNDIGQALTDSLDRTGRGGMLAPFKIFDGGINAPGLAFTNEPTLGVWRSGTGQMELVNTGKNILSVYADRAVSNYKLYIADGTVGAPGIAFTNDPDNGFYHIAADNWGAVAAGSEVLDFSSARVATPATVTLSLNGPLACGAAATFQNAVTVQGSLATSGAGKITALGSTGLIASGTTIALEVRSLAGSDAAYMGFHRAGVYAGYFGLDTDNQWKIGGWSYGAVSYQILHEANSFTVAPGVLTYGGTISVQALTLPNGNSVLTNNGTTNVNAISCTTINANNNVNCRDVIASRGNGTGGVLLTDGSKYFYYDGTRYAIPTANIATDGFIGAGIGQAATPLTTIDAKTTGNTHMLFGNSSGIPYVGACTDGFGSWLNFGIGSQSTVFPLIDNASTFGKSGNRWAQLWSTSNVIQTSDARQKKNVTDSDLGLAFIESLRPISYQWINGGNVVTREPDYEEDVPESYTIEGDKRPPEKRTIYRDVITPTEGKRTHYGLIAQEVAQAVAASGVVDFGGYVQTDLADPQSELVLNYREFIAPNIKAVQELSERVKAL